MSGSCDILIIGGGIVGLATAYQLGRAHPERRLILLEKEPDLAQHQTGHNSGVLHSGIYYRPASLKAVNCRTGRQAMLEFCAREGVPHQVCGKVIVATAQEELERLQDLYERGRANGVQCELIGPERLRELEPHCAGLQAIHVPEAGIVDFRQVCRRFAVRIEEGGHRIIRAARVTGLSESEGGVVVESAAGAFRGRWVVNCAGLHSDRVAALSGELPPARIVPFRGEYYELSAEVEHLCRNLIYPVPDPQFPFLGVHFTRMIGGGIECGPNAVLAFAREGYRKQDINLRDLAETLGYSGFRRLAVQHWRMGLGEMWRSVNKAAFVRALQRLIPEVRGDQLKAAPAGVRAQAVAPDGRMVDDFALVEGKRMLHVINAPSPAATASLSIAATLVKKLAERF